MRWQKYIFERVDIVWFNLPGLMCVDLKIAFFSVFVQSVRVLYTCLGDLVVLCMM